MTSKGRLADLVQHASTFNHTALLQGASCQSRPAPGHIRSVMNFVVYNLTMSASSGMSRISENSDNLWHMHLQFVVMSFCALGTC